MVQPKNPLNYVLGIDAGHASVGWAVVEIDAENRPIRLHSAGVRRFDAGVVGDVERGKDETLSKKRRDARGPRRQTWRRQRRLRNVFRALQQFGLLPTSESDEHDARHQLLAQLDKDLCNQLNLTPGRAANHVFPYQLRALALDSMLPPYALGRALYHLAQRRGFLSNLKVGRDSDERSVVKKGISELQQAIEASNSRTLGEYFAGLDPESERIRGRWTSRQMYLDEFQQIWKQQQPHHPQLTDACRETLHDAIFGQRPLKSQRGLIGRCDLEPYKRRAPIACLPFQHFRSLQRVNDLEVVCPDGELRILTQEERQLLLAELESQGDLSWAAVRKTLGMKKSAKYGRNFEFNLEQGGDKKLIGNRTAAKIISVIEDTWHVLDDRQQIELVDDLLAFESEDELMRHLQRRWKLPESAAIALAEMRLEDGYGSLSRRAINRLSRLMLTGEPFASARKQLYGDQLATSQVCDFLPPFAQVMRNVRNPAVARTMAELRKVVNAIIREHGVPTLVRIELARDLKNSRDRRRQMTELRDRNTNVREKALQKLLQEMGERYATDRNVLKLRLAEECNWQCPYTGRSFGMEELVGDESQFDIEHIIPFSRSLDNSFANKTLCYHEENRRRKQGRSPYQAYHGTNQWEEILDRVRHFNGDCAARKLHLFQTAELPNAEEFIQRQLNDTRYLSRAAAEYLACLFGGRTDAEGKLRVQVSPGRVTGFLRRNWDLNRILGHPDAKDRADHRHHAIDAFVIALSSPKFVQELSAAAERAEDRDLDDLFVDVQLPWQDYHFTQVGEIVGQIVVSSRVNRKLSGALHEETILSKPQPISDNGKPTTIHHVRKPLANMSLGEIEAIVDPVVRKAVADKLAQIGGEPKKAFADPNNHPYLTSRDGRLIPIHAARIRKPDATIQVGRDSRLRYVCPGENHHMAIYVETDKKGREKWRGRIVSRFEAVRRLREDDRKVIRRSDSPNCKFVFSLANGEHVAIPTESGQPRLLRVTVISGEQIEFVDHFDARPITIRKKTPGARFRCSVDKLRTLEAKKVEIDPLGGIRPAGD